MLKQVESCVFCGIAEGRIVSSKVLEADKVIAFTALEGGYPLLIPRKHIRNWGDGDLDEKTINELTVVQAKLVRVVMDLGAEGVSIISNNGKAAGQEIDHLHVHIMPRNMDDGLIRFKRSERLERTQLDLKASLYRVRLIELGLI